MGVHHWVWSLCQLLAGSGYIVSENGDALQPIDGLDLNTCLAQGRIFRPDDCPKACPGKAKLCTYHDMYKLKLVDVGSLGFPSQTVLIDLNLLWNLQEDSCWRFKVHSHDLLSKIGFQFGLGATLDKFAVLSGPEDDLLLFEVVVKSSRHNQYEVQDFILLYTFFV